MMNDKEYVKQLNLLVKKMLLSDNNEERVSAVDDFQEKHMQEFCEELETHDIPYLAKEALVNTVQSAIQISTSGNVSIVLEDLFDSPEKAKEAFQVLEEQGVLWQELGDMLLDDESRIEEDGTHCIDVIFGGNYVPHWDGWEENNDVSSYEYELASMGVDIDTICDISFLTDGLIEFSKTFDFYEYMDTVGSDSESLASDISRDLFDGKISSYIDYIKDALSEDITEELRSQGEELLSMLHKQEELLSKQRKIPKR